VTGGCWLRCDATWRGLQYCTVYSRVLSNSRERRSCNRADEKLLVGWSRCTTVQRFFSPDPVVMLAACQPAVQHCITLLILKLESAMSLQYTGAMEKSKIAVPKISIIDMTFILEPSLIENFLN